jgi:uncharacterized protein
MSQKTDRNTRLAAVTDTRALRSDEPLAVELTAALKRGEVDQLRRLLAANPGLAHCAVENSKGGGRTPLHLFADWPGHNSKCCRDRPHPRCGCLNWPAPWSGQTPLDIADREGRSDIVAWLLGRGAIRGSR